MKIFQILLYMRVFQFIEQQGGRGNQSTLFTNNVCQIYLNKNKKNKKTRKIQEEQDEHEEQEEQKQQEKQEQEQL